LENNVSIPWWRNSEKYQIGLLTKKARRIRLRNTLVEDDEFVLEVCKEEKLSQIRFGILILFIDELFRARFLERNAHAHSYTWKHLGRVLDMTKTLEGYFFFFGWECCVF
jgi:hypothetical protein